MQRFLNWDDDFSQISANHNIIFPDEISPTLDCSFFLQFLGVELALFPDNYVQQFDYKEISLLFPYLLVNCGVYPCVRVKQVHDKIAACVRRVAFNLNILQ